MKQPTTLKPAEFHREVYRHAVAQGEVYEDVLKPSYWANVARVLQPGAKIEVIDTEGAYYAELYVSAVGSHSAQVVELYRVELRKPEVVAIDDEFEVKFRGPLRWSVIRKSDSKPVLENIATKDQAINDLADYKKALAA